MSDFAKPKPHAVLIPAPFQGHINPLLKLAKLLHLRGFHITFVNTEYNHKRLLKSRGPNSLDGFTDFSFETIPDVSQSVRNNFLQPFGELLAKLQDSATAGLVPPVTCIVSDCLMSFTIQAAEEYALPIIFFCPASACSFLTALHFRTLIEKGLIPLKGNDF